MTETDTLSGENIFPNINKSFRKAKPNHCVYVSTGFLYKFRASSKATPTIQVIRDK